MSGTWPDLEESQPEPEYGHNDRAFVFETRRLLFRSEHNFLFSPRFKFFKWNHLLKSIKLFKLEEFRGKQQNNRKFWRRL
jgi:hypothetical protein